MKAFLSILTPWRIAALVAVAVLGAMAFFFKFVLPGYSFTALVCLLLIALILFYAFFPLLGTKFPKFTKITLRVCSAVLCVGLLIALVTEAVIVRHSFGDPKEQVGYMDEFGNMFRNVTK